MRVTLRMIVFFLFLLFFCCSSGTQHIVLHIVGISFNISDPCTLHIVVIAHCFLHTVGAM